MARIVFELDGEGQLHRFIEGFSQHELIGIFTVELELATMGAMSETLEGCDHLHDEGEEVPKTYH